MLMISRMLLTLLSPPTQLTLIHAPFLNSRKNTFSLLVANLKESSALPVIQKYSGPNAADYGDAQLLNQVLVAHYTQGFVWVPMP